MALSEQSNKLLEEMLNDIDPQWKEHEAERKAAKVSRKQKPEPKKEIVEMTKSNMVDADVMKVLKSAWCDGLKVYLPPAQMERKLYERTNEVLTCIGGKWKGGKTKAHVFEDDPAPLLAEVLATGIMPLDNPLDFYETPADVISLMLDRVIIEPTAILEPSAGRGAIVKAAKSKYSNAILGAIEIDPKRAEILRTIAELNVYEGDFFQNLVSGFYDLVLMNPPFTSQRDRKEYIAHIYNAYEILKHGGQLIAIAPAGLKFNSDKRTVELKEFIQRRGGIEDLPSGAFGDNGTMVSTVLVNVTKNSFYG